MSEHTKEPWTLGKGDVSVREDSGRKRFICRTHIPGDNRPMPREEQAANAARIVACVNACAAIPTADLATGVVPIAEYNRIKALLAEQDEFRRDGYDVLASACADDATGVVPVEVVRRLVEACDVSVRRDLAANIVAEPWHVVDGNGKIVSSHAEPTNAIAAAERIREAAIAKAEQAMAQGAGE